MSVRMSDEIFPNRCDIFLKYIYIYIKYIFKWSNFFGIRLEKIRIKADIVYCVFQYSGKLLWYMNILVLSIAYTCFTRNPPPHNKIVEHESKAADLQDYSQVKDANRTLERIVLLRPHQAQIEHSI